MLGEGLGTSTAQTVLVSPYASSLSGASLAPPQWDSCPAGVGAPASEQDSYATCSLPLKYGQSSQVLPCYDFWLFRQDRVLQTRSRLENLGNPFASILKSNAYSNWVEWGQRSSLMIISIIQWLQFAPNKATPGLRRLFSCLLPPRNIYTG